MKAVEARVLHFLKNAPQFVIPIYQRTYSWTEKECRQLWDDVLRAGSDDTVHVHFIGSIVYIERADANLAMWEPYLIIDGQQRLTSITLLLSAVAKAAGNTEPLDGFSAQKICEYYLQNTVEKGDRKFKLLLSQTDRDSLIAVVTKREQPVNQSIRIVENAQLFDELVSQQKDDLLPLLRGISKLWMVDIKLKRGEDNPQLIFESMNSTGKELSQADLIRNFILMDLEPDFQTSLYQDYWRPMELGFGQEAYSDYFDAFMRHYLTAKTGAIPNVGEVYEAFKLHAARERLNATNATEHTENLVRDIRNYAGYFCVMALDGDAPPPLKEAFQDLRELKVDVAYPFLLELYRDFADGRLQQSDFLAIIRLVESYVFRRAVCEIPTNSLNKTFANFGKSLRKQSYLESVTAQLLLLRSYRRFPSDDEFKRHLLTRDLYNFRSRSYWLRRLENHGRRERVAVAEYTIEHLMPQNEALSSEWRQALGPDWKRVHDTWLHTIGNLTLTAYNSDYSDRPFLEKRDMPSAPEKGLRSSPLKLNQGLGELEVWNEEAIQGRAARLSGLATTVWPAPSLSSEVLQAYEPDNTRVSEYTLRDHPHLLSPAVRPLFEAFRKAVLELDACVREEFLKLYVAYKAETNFVDAIPQAGGLRLVLNMRFADLDDPRGLARDITGLGRWGNGDVQIRLSNSADLAYVIGLVRQSLELQLGEPAAV